MITQTIYREKKKQLPKKVVQLPVQRIILLIILAYEALGCLLGGFLLIAAPDGRFMQMPVDMMHGVFPDFLIPGIILFALGVLTTIAFISVMRRTPNDWFISGLALGGLFIWFIVEIIILQEVHWLHLMWGAPVVLGWMALIPLIVMRNNTVRMKKLLLGCGIFSSLWYITINILVPMYYDGYSMLDQAPSELSAFNAPTRVLWLLLVSIYPILFAAFGWGVLLTAKESRLLRVVGTLTIVYCICNIYWPPMHMRQVIASGGATLTDDLHIVWAGLTLILMMILMGFGAAALGKTFRIYTITTFVVFIVFGTLTFLLSPGMEANRPTPWMGLWERINIAAFMIWVIVFAEALLRNKWKNVS